MSRRFTFPFPLDAIDSYKLGHPVMYPKGTEYVYGTFTPRSYRHARGIFPEKFWDNRLVVFGTTGTFAELKYMFDEHFFSRDKEEVLAEFAVVIAPYIGDNDPTELLGKIGALHDLGFLPLRVKAIPEGYKIPENVPMYTIQTTRKGFSWVGQYLETYLSSQSWKLATNATIAGVYRSIFVHYAEKTGTPIEFVDYQGHDFSSRGMSNIFDAARSGAAHLTSFYGSDAVSASRWIDIYYPGTTVKGVSVPATEHSVICLGGKELTSEVYIETVEKNKASKEATLKEWEESFPNFVKFLREVESNDGVIENKTQDGVWYSYDFDNKGNTQWYRCAHIENNVITLLGEEDVREGGWVWSEYKVPQNVNTGELHTFKRLLDKYPKGVVSIVSDTWDFWTTITDMASVLKEDIMSRQPDQWGLAKTVFRPDSGDPVQILCGTSSYKAPVTSLVDKMGYDQAKEVFINLYDPEQIGAVHCLYNTFGGTVTEKGFIQLDQHVGLIYGDSITPNRAVSILEGLSDKGFASGNVVLGIGSYTYNFSTRDTFGFALKATYAEIDGVPTMLQKEPKTDTGKKSHRGKVRIEKDGATYKVIDGLTDDSGGILEVIFEDGVLYNQVSLDVIRQRLRDVQ